MDLTERLVICDPNIVAVLKHFSGFLSGVWSAQPAWYVPDYDGRLKVLQSLWRACDLLVLPEDYKKVHDIVDKLLKEGERLTVHVKDDRLWDTYAAALQDLPVKLRAREEREKKEVTNGGEPLPMATGSHVMEERTAKKMTRETGGEPLAMATGSQVKDVTTTKEVTNGGEPLPMATGPHVMEGRTAEVKENGGEALHQPMATRSGKVVRKKVDYTVTCDESLPKLCQLAKDGSVTQAISELLALETQTRTGRDMQCTGRVLVTIVQVCSEAKNWPLLVEHIHVLSRCRGQLKQAVKMVQEVCNCIDALPTKELQTEALEQLCTNTDRESYEFEHQFFKLKLEEVKADLAASSEDISLDAEIILEELQVETNGSMEQESGANAQQPPTFPQPTSTAPRSRVIPAPVKQSGQRRKEPTQRTESQDGPSPSQIRPTASRRGRPQKRVAPQVPPTPATSPAAAPAPEAGRSINSGRRVCDVVENGKVCNEVFEGDNIQKRFSQHTRYHHKEKYVCTIDGCRYSTPFFKPQIVTHLMKEDGHAYTEAEAVAHYKKCKDMRNGHGRFNVVVNDGGVVNFNFN